MSRIDFVTGAPEKYAHLVDALATVPDRLRQVVNGAGSGDLRRQPEDGGWPAQRVLEHLAVYSHINGVFIHRMATMYDAERVPYDEDVLIAEWSYGGANAERLLEEIEREVGKTVDFLAETPDAAWGRRGMVRGFSRSVRQQVQRHIDHYEEHLLQIATLLGAEERVAGRA